MCYYIFQRYYTSFTEYHHSFQIHLIHTARFGLIPYQLILNTKDLHVLGTIIVSILVYIAFSNIILLCRYRLDDDRPRTRVSLRVNKLEYRGHKPCLSAYLIYWYWDCYCFYVINQKTITSTTTTNSILKEALRHET